MHKYLEKILHTQVTVHPATTELPLPLYLKGLFKCEQWDILDASFVVAQPQENLSVNTLARHMAKLQVAFGLPVAFTYNSATAYRTNRMIEEGIPFVVKERQVYLPFLGVALQKEHEATSLQAVAGIDKVSTQTQRFILRAIYDGWAKINVTQAATEMDVSKVTISRAFDELSAINPNLVASEKRTRLFRLEVDKRTLWEEILPHLFNPVVREYRLDHIPADGHLTLGGTSAMSHHSMLADNRYPTFAITKAQEQELGLKNNRNLVEWEEWEQPACVVQVMRYRLDSMDQEAIDPLSAILSLSEKYKEDPRIQGEIEHMLRGVFQ